MTRTIISLDDLDGLNGYRLELPDFTTTNVLVASAGDINSDGFADFVVGDRFFFTSDDKIFVVFGRDGDFAPVEELGTPDGDNGFRLEGLELAIGTSSPYAPSVAAAGDVNGDGIDDLVAVDRAFRFVAGSGSVYDVSVVVVSGRDGESDPVIDVGSGGDRSLAVRYTVPFIDGQNFSIAGVGDMNGDGLGDFVVGTAFANGFLGGAFVVFGRTGGFDTPLDPSALDGLNGFRLTAERGLTSGALLGNAVSGAGDLNGDGLDDLVISAPGFDPDDDDPFAAGRSYVLFGAREGFAASVDLSKLDGKNGFVFDGKDGSAQSGRSLANIGDINGDGVDDLIVGGSGQGQAYVLFGRTDGFAPRYSVGGAPGVPNPEIDPRLGFILPFAGDLVAAAGDVDGDGANDLLVSSRSTRNGGQVHVLYGRKDGGPIVVERVQIGPGSFDLKPDGSNGFSIDLGSLGAFFQPFLSGPGDVNGDGYDDIVIATSDTEDGPGAVHVIFGAPRTPPTQTVTVSLSGQAFQGDPRFDLFVNGEAVATGVAVPSSAAPPAPGTRPPAQTFTFEVDADIDIERVGVAFVNDRFGGAPDRDRNLFVESVSFGGETYGPGPDALYIGPGQTNVAVARDIEATGALRRNGLLEFGEHREITVYAAGQAFQGDPRFDLLVNGALVARGVAVDSASGARTRAQLEDAAEAFVFRVSRGVEIDEVSVRFTNDRFGGDRTRDRNLFVDRIEIDDGDGPVRVLEAEIDGVYTRAAGQVIGPSERMLWNGQLVFDDLGVAV